MNKLLQSASVVLPQIKHLQKMLLLTPVDWNKWLDQWGNYILLKDKKSNFVIPKNQKVKPLDIYIKSPPDFFIDKSYWTCWWGEKNKIRCYIGNDGVLRVCLFENDQWVENIPPMLLGKAFVLWVCESFVEDKVAKNVKVIYPEKNIVLITGEKINAV